MTTSFSMDPHSGSWQQWQLEVRPDHNFKTLCAKECNSVPLNKNNLDQICNSPCILLCPSLCTPLFSHPPFHPNPPIPPLIPPRNLAQTDLIATVLTMIACMLLAAFISSIFIYFAARLRSKRRTRRTPAVYFDGSPEDDSIEQGPGTVHHIWNLNAVGLQQSVIDLITVFKYKKDELLVEGSECAVCLGEFEEDESLKLLPKCSHAFHVPCIDTWLTSHKNCPLCRAPIVIDGFNAQVGLVLEIFTDSSSSSSSSGNRVMRRQEGEEGTSEARNVGNSGITNLENEVKIMKKSVSLDSYSGQAVRKTVGNVVAGGSQCLMSQLKDLKEKNILRCGSVSFRKLTKSSSLGHMLQKGPISMKRSFSCIGKSSSSSSYSMRHSKSFDSILPL